MLMNKESKLRKNRWFRMLRVRQYTKNSFIFAPMIFDGQLLNQQALLRTFLGMILLCLLSSGIYIINDLIDIDSDRQHPRKKYRPIAAGQISKKSAILCAGVLLAAALAGAALLSPRFLVLCLIIAALNLLYSLKLKHYPIIDVMTIGLLFILRVLCGAAIVPVKMFSPWLYIVTFMLALFLGFGKRRAELALMADASAQTRPVLDGYSLPFLDQLITIVSSMTIMAYSLYTFSGPTLPANNKMMLTIPFVVYGVFRYQYLIEIKHQGGAPEEVLLSDRWLQATILLYALTAILAIYS